MSYTEITFFGKNGKPKFDADIKNAWRGAMAIWDIMDERYLPPYIPDWAKDMPDRKSRYSRMISMGGNKHLQQQVWDIWKLPNCTETDRIVMGSTFDWVIVLKKDVPRLLQAFRDFVGETSLKEQASIIEDAFKDKTIIAVGWNQTSVCENRWNTYEYDEKKDRSIPYNLNKGEKHWSLFPSILTSIAHPNQTT